MDGWRWMLWMTCAINSMPHQSWRLGFALAVGPRFFIAKRSIVVNTIHLYLFKLFKWPQGGGNGWMAADGVG
jgi:hypothetical protein